MSIKPNPQHLISSGWTTEILYVCNNLHVVAIIIVQIVGVSSPIRKKCAILYIFVDRILHNLFSLPLLRLLQSYFFPIGQFEQSFLHVSAVV